jgi:hypothetical protein
MTLNIPYQRLCNQRLEGEPLQSAVEVVGWLGAVQAQEYAGAKWALGLRMHEATEAGTPTGVRSATIEQAFNDGAILRTHVMRPTWHFVTPEDIRWILALTAERVTARMAYYDRQIGLDAAVYRQSGAALAKAMQGGKQLTRAEVTLALARAGIEAKGQRFIHLLMRAELEGLICSGARRGKQFTYTLLDERAPMPTGGQLTREEALAELTRRYFTSHGPATVQDFGWWSGLTLADGKAGIEMAGEQLGKETVDGKTYWFGAGTAEVGSLTGLAGPVRLEHRALLLPPYDEYGIAYKDHSPTLPAEFAARAVTDRFGGLMALDGQGLGYWRRSISKGRALIELAPFRAIMAEERAAFGEAARRYGEFIEMEVEVR